MREAIVNALAHRDYASAAAVQALVFADRVEIWNFFANCHPDSRPPACASRIPRSRAMRGSAKRSFWRATLRSSAPERKTNDLVYVCAPAPLQVGVANGIAQVPPEYYDDLQRAFDRKRQMIGEALHHAGFRFPMPQGAYYMLADASHLPGETSKQKAMSLLEKTGVASVPGEAFYHDGAGENLLRFCYAKEDADLEEACRRLGGLHT